VIDEYERFLVRQAMSEARIQTLQRRVAVLREWRLEIEALRQSRSLKKAPGQVRLLKRREAAG